MVMEITTSQKTIDVFTVDGRDFTSREDAEAHLARLTEQLEYTYFLVRHGFDQTEGRGYFAQRIVGVIPETRRAGFDNAVVTYLLREIGEPILEWHGRAVWRWVVSDGKRFNSVEALTTWVADIEAYCRYDRRFEGVHFCDDFGNKIDGPKLVVAKDV
jgi:hypothetical protein